MNSFVIFLHFLILTLCTLVKSKSSLCRTSCGDIQINYPFGIDDGCGSPYYRNILVCSNSNNLELRTPSGRYPIRRIDYSDPHILVTDPNMWNCQDGPRFRPPRPFSLDTSIHFSLSTQNDYLFFNCSEKDVIVEPKPIFCERFPDRCDSTCDSASYLCRHLPECPHALGGSTSCCSYYPKAIESLRLMLKYCDTYTSVYWKNLGVSQSYNTAPEYGIRVDFDIPVTSRCLQCQDGSKGGGTCGFDVETHEFSCLCDKGNVTTYCKDHSQHGKSSHVVAGTATAVSVAGAVGIGAGVWYFKKVKAQAPVTHGVQSNENRLF